MLKIITKKEYKELLEYKQKYEEITGKRWYIITGGRTVANRLMQLSKESLINVIMEMREDIRKLNKKLRKDLKTRVEEVSNE